MKVVGVEGISPQQVQEELQRGAKFVIYNYCISVIVMTFKRGSDIYYIRPGENRIVKGLGFTLLSLVAGWWGFPWGPIYTVTSLVTNFSGGKDVTAEVAASILPRATAYAPVGAGYPQQQPGGYPPQPGAYPPPPGAVDPNASTPPNYYSQPPR